MYSNNNTYKWIIASGAFFTLIAFFMAFLNINVLGIPIGVSLSTIASTDGQFLLYFLPLSMVGVAVLSLIPTTDDDQARKFMTIQLVAWIVGILFMGIALIALFSKLNKGEQAADFFGGIAGGLFGLGDIESAIDLFTVTPAMGLFLFVFGNIAIIIGLMMGWKQLGGADAYPVGPIPPGWDVGEPTRPVVGYPKSATSRPHKPKTQAWLTARDGKSFQLCKGRTSIGRSSENDIYITDPTIGRRHAIIEEQNGHYRLTDLASKNHTWLNGRQLRQPTLIHPDDEIRFGDSYTVRFLASNR